MIFKRGKLSKLRVELENNVNAMKYATRRGFYSLVIVFLNSSLILSETSTRTEGRHHQYKNNIDGKIARKLVNGTYTNHMVLIQFELVGHRNRRTDF